MGGVVPCPATNLVELKLMARLDKTSGRAAPESVDGAGVSLAEPLLDCEAAAVLLNVRVSWVRDAARQGHTAFAALVSTSGFFEYASRRCDLPLAAVERVKYDNRSGGVLLPGGVAHAIRCEARDARCESPQLRGVGLRSDHADRRERDDEPEGPSTLLRVASVNWHLRGSEGVSYACFEPVDVAGDGRERFRFNGRAIGEQPAAGGAGGEHKDRL